MMFPAFKCFSDLGRLLLCKQISFSSHTAPYWSQYHLMWGTHSSRSHLVSPLEENLIHLSRSTSGCLSCLSLQSKCPRQSWMWCARRCGGLLKSWDEHHNLHKSLRRRSMSLSLVPRRSNSDPHVPSSLDRCPCRNPALCFPSQPLRYHCHCPLLMSKERNVRAQSIEHWTNSFLVHCLKAIELWLPFELSNDSRWPTSHMLRLKIE